MKTIRTSRVTVEIKNLVMSNRPPGQGVPAQMEVVLAAAAGSFDIVRHRSGSFGIAALTPTLMKSCWGIWAVLFGRSDAGEGFRFHNYRCVPSLRRHCYA